MVGVKTGLISVGQPIHSGPQNHPMIYSWHFESITTHPTTSDETDNGLIKPRYNSWRLVLPLQIIQSSLKPYLITALTHGNTTRHQPIQSPKQRHMCAACNAGLFWRNEVTALWRFSLVLRGLSLKRGIFLFFSPSLEVPRESWITAKGATLRILWVLFVPLPTMSWFV